MPDNLTYFLNKKRLAENINQDYLHMSVKSNVLIMKTFMKAKVKNQTIRSLLTNIE